MAIASDIYIRRFHNQSRTSDSATTTDVYGASTLHDGSPGGLRPMNGHVVLMTLYELAAERTQLIPSMYY